MQLFYAEKINGNSAVLNESESRHCLKVLRKNEGDSIFVTDGKGNCYEGQLIVVKKKIAMVNHLVLVGQQQRKEPLISLAIAPTKNNSRLEWLLEKAVEIGLVELQPFISVHSERKRINDRRLSDIALSAMKQSGRYWLPEIKPLLSLKELVISEQENCNLNLIGSQSSDQNIVNLEFTGKSRICLFIGPEGDFSEEELEMMHQKGFIFVNLGSHRLRTETAGLVGITLINSMIN